MSPLDPAPLRSLPRLTPVELTWGWPFGSEEGRDSPAAARRRASAPSPRAALEALLLDALRRGPVVVSFSGGRDSSAVLAVAVHVARREGLPLPAALTLRYPGLAETDETQWQELVAAHLDVQDWAIRPVTDEQGALAAPARAVLRAAGAPLFPPSAATLGLELAAAQGATLVTGGYGDWVLGTKRMTVAHNVWRRRGKVPATVWRRVGIDLAPARLTHRHRTTSGLALPWLRPGADRAMRTAIRAELSSTPLRWDREVRSLLRQRFFRIGADVRRAVASAHGSRLLEPLGESSVVTAYAAAGGWAGFPSRTAGMRHLVGDLLPEAILTRSTKAVFNAASFGSAVQRFAADWDGCGVDPELVDVEALRREWSSAAPHALSMSLLQQAWLAEDGGAR